MKIIHSCTHKSGPHWFNVLAKCLSEYETATCEEISTENSIESSGKTHVNLDSLLSEDKFSSKQKISQRKVSHEK